MTILRRFKRRSRVSRDKDYRGVKTTVNWSHLVHQVRTKKPGALEVLQDAIREWFPQQFEDATYAARQASKNVKSETIYVGFNAKLARWRFKPRGHRSATTEESSPFVLWTTSKQDHEFIVIMDRAGSKRRQLWVRLSLSSSRPPQATALVYAAKGNHDFWGGYGPLRTSEEANTREKLALHPKRVNTYKRPKIPVIYFYHESDDGDDRTILLVRGPGSREWAREKHDIAGESWDLQPNGAIAVLYGHDDWLKDARREGYRNKTRYLQYPPSRNFFDG